MKEENLTFVRVCSIINLTFVRLCSIIIGYNLWCNSCQINGLEKNLDQYLALDFPY